jgi:hypothetical protein
MTYREAIIKVGFSFHHKLEHMHMNPVRKVS